MDDKSKKSSIASGSLYMSANDFELKEMSNARLVSEASNDSIRAQTSMITAGDNRSDYDNQSGRPGDLNSVEERRDSSKSVETSMDKAPSSPPPPPPYKLASNEEDETSSLLATPTTPNETTELIQRAPAPDTELNESDEEAERKSLLISNTDVEANQREQEAKSPINIDYLRTKLSLIIGSFFGGCGILFAIILLIILIPMCLHSLQYDEYGLIQSRLTGVVNDRKTYEGGLHFLSPFSQFIKFKRTAHSFKLTDISIFTTDILPVKATFVIYYFLEKEKIGMLYRKYGLKYESIVEKVSRSELINHGQDFPIESYRLKRLEVKNHLKKVLRTRLEQEFGLDLLDLYMHELRFSRIVNDKNLVRELNTIYNEQAGHVKKSAIINAETRLQVVRYQNQAQILLKSAELEGNNTLIKMEEINAENRLEKAHLTGLNNTLDKLEFTKISNQKERVQKSLSLCWVNALLYHERINFIYSDGFKKNEFSTILGSFEL